MDRRRVSNSASNLFSDCVSCVSAQGFGKVPKAASRPPKAAISPVVALKIPAKLAQKLGLSLGLSSGTRVSRLTDLLP